MRKQLMLLASFLVAAAGVQAATYYIDGINGNDSGDGTTVASAWKTIGRANYLLRAGDTVYLLGGTYSETIRPGASGRPGEYITYAAYQGEEVIVTEVVFAVQIFEKDYIRISGITFRDLDRFLFIRGSEHAIIEDCVFSRFRGDRTASWSGSQIYQSSQYNTIRNCVFSEHGYFTDQDTGTVFDIGHETDTGDQSNFNLIENCTLFYGGHHVLGIYGKQNVIRNNHIHNEPWSAAPSGVVYGNRNINVNGYPGHNERNLFEGNTIAFGSPAPDDPGSEGLKITSRYNIVRNNFFYHNELPGVFLMAFRGTYYNNSPRYNLIYNNTFYSNGHLATTSQEAQQAGIGLADYGWSGEPIAANVIRNNAFHENRSERSVGAYRVDLGAQIIDSNWLDTAGDPLFMDLVGGDPSDASAYDFGLLPGSPLIDAGAFLTSITSSSGSGTSFVVADAGYFMDGWGIVEADEIQLEGQADSVRVTSVDYATNTITVASPIRWTAGTGVALAFSGNAPDIGAVEYGASSPPPGASLIKPSGLEVREP